MTLEDLLLLTGDFCVSVRVANIACTRFVAQWNAASGEGATVREAIDDCLSAIERAINKRTT